MKNPLPLYGRAHNAALFVSNQAITNGHCSFIAEIKYTFPFWQPTANSAGLIEQQQFTAASNSKRNINFRLWTAMQQTTPSSQPKRIILS